MQENDGELYRIHEERTRKANERPLGIMKENNNTTKTTTNTKTLGELDRSASPRYTLRHVCKLQAKMSLVVRTRDIQFPS